MAPPILTEFPRPLVFAHRGLSTIFPENTMASFRAARDAGIPGIELDVHLTRDRKLVVFHDDTTERIVRPEGAADATSGAGAASKGDHASAGGPGTPVPLAYSIEETDYSLLSSLDIGSWKDARFAGERMPLLDDVLAEFGSSMYFDIEIKSRTTGDAGLEALLVASIRRFGMNRRCIVSSFNPIALRRFKKLAPPVPTAIIWCRSPELHWFLQHGEGRWIAATDILKPEHCLVKHKRLHERLARPIIPWTVDTDADAARVLKCGVAGIVSNCPQFLSLGK